MNIPRANINKSLSGINCCHFCDKDIICAFTTAWLLEIDVAPFFQSITITKTNAKNYRPISDLSRHYQFYVDYTVFRVGRITFFPANRVENQNEPKRPQSGGRLGSFWFSTRPTAMGGTDYNLHLVSEALWPLGWSTSVTSVHGVD